MTSLDSFKCRKTLKVGGKTYVYYSLPTAEKNGLKGISKLPYSMKVLLENLLRNEDGRTVKKEDIVAVSKWLKKRALEHEIAFRPARVLMQDFTGVPAVVDLAAMRNAMQALGGDAEKINPLVPVDLVIDHSVIVNFFGDNKAFGKNVVEEYKQNQERYEFLKWGQKALSRSPIRIRSSAPIRTPPWSTVSPCSAGASAASRRKPRCSASRCRCCCRKWSASSSRDSSRKVLPPPIWC